MKKILSIISLVLVFTMLTTITASAMGQFSADVLKNPDYSLNENGFKYVEKSAYDTGYKQNIFYGEYNTTAEDAEYEWVIHSIRNGNNTKASTVMQIAKDYENTTGRKVIMATNGDYFYNTGSNVESYVNQGIVLTKGNMPNKHCIGFDNNGKVVVGRMTETETRLALYDENGAPIFFEIDKFNSLPSANEIAVYNTVGSYDITNAGVIVVGSTSTNLSQYPVWGSDASLFNKEVFESKSITLKSGQYAVVYGAELAETFNKVVYGDSVDLVEIPAGQFEGCTWVLGGYDILVNDYVVNTDCHDDNGGKGDAPRTFVGFKEDGTGFLCVVDGRMAGGSYGIWVEQEAQLAGVLGAQFALELDGGGSSTMIIRENDELVLRNVPSDGAMRSVSNAIMLVEKPEEEIPHEHSFVDGKCKCGETDPSYQPPHEHNFVEGKCECGETDPDYTSPETPIEPELPEEPKLNFFQKIWKAIVNFFRSLFGKK